MRLTPDPLRDRAFSALDARLQRDVDHPVALALSGGGDSMALLALAADWARRRGRRLLALTVDHGLNPDSAGWTAFAARAAAAAGADWRGLAWRGDKPVSGLPAAARAARHALIADAARAAGARVVLFAHTADDIAEADWMRAGGATLGRLRDWSPSPVWPEGRGLMLARPLLGERREALRAWLRRQGLDWLDDPANADERFGRARARRALGGEGPRSTPDDPSVGSAPPGRTIRAIEPGALLASRDASATVLAAALVCAGGGSTPPRGRRLEALRARLAGGEDVAAVLSGARVRAVGDAVRIQREPGEWRRRPALSPILTPHRPTVWDGRFEITVGQPGWRVAPAAGRMAGLGPADRAALGALSAALRPTLPVLIRDDGRGPVLAGTDAGQGIAVHCLVSRRLDLFLGEVTHETGLSAANDGGTAVTDLFLSDDGAMAPDRVT